MIKLGQILLILTLISISCTSVRKFAIQSSIYDLSETQKDSLVSVTKRMLEFDQRYRSIVSLGTLKKELIEKNNEMSEKASLEEYMGFLKSIKKDITQQQTDSLWNLQHKLDYNNYLNLKLIVNKYGYPSKERLGISEDIFPILLHPPIELNPKDYLNEMENLLIKEVYAKRMDANQFAMFVDNIKVKILQEPQIYGTNNSFDYNTMKLGLPTIKDIKTTNKRRKKIGLEELKEGEYLIGK
jgi:hypothetical protein